MNRSFLILDDSVDIKLLSKTELTGLREILCMNWLSPEAKGEIKEAAGVTPRSLPEIINNLEEWEDRAFSLVTALTKDGPSYSGVQLRAFISQQLFNEALELTLALDAVEMIEELRNGEKIAVDCLVSSSFKKFLRIASEKASSQVQYLFHDGPVDCIPNGSRPPVVRRIQRRFREARLMGTAKSELWEIAAELDNRYRFRAFYSRLRSMPQVNKGAITFFSSYSNSSQRLRAFEPLMPLPVNWVLLNYSARQGAEPTTNPVYWLWEFHQGPSSGMKDSGFPKRGDGDAAFIEAWLRVSPTWNYWINVGLPSLEVMTGCWTTYLKIAQPGLVVIANQWDIEGWLLRITRQAGIPVIQLLHGAMLGYYYKNVPLFSNKMIVWGDLWKRRCSKQAQERIIVFNPDPEPSLPDSREIARKPRLTFFSWALNKTPYLNEYELQDGFIRVLNELVQSGLCDLTIRAHPRENTDDLRRRWQNLFGSFPSSIRLSKQELLNKILAETDIAVMYHSTVMLNCFAASIPTVIPGWMDFGWNDALAGAPGVHFARDFKDLEETLFCWIKHPPAMDREKTRDFIDLPQLGTESFNSVLHELIKH